MDKQNLRNAMAGCYVEDGTNADNLAIALCTYFSDHQERPDGDEALDSENGWGPWVESKANAALAAIANACIRQSDDQAVGRIGDERIAVLFDNARAMLVHHRDENAEDIRDLVLAYSSLRATHASAVECLRDIAVRGGNHLEAQRWLREHGSMT
jgi:hypothetical protein